MLKQFIQNSGVKQRDWARRFGVTEGHLSSILSGRKGVSLSLAVRIQRETGGKVPADSLLDLGSAGPNPSNAA